MLMTKEQITLFRKAIKDRKIKVIGFDLETSPSKFWGWGTGEQYVSHEQLVDGTETKIITAQYREYLIDKKSKALVWKKGRDQEVVRGIVKILNSADIVIAQNGKAFDVKVLQERTKLLKLPPVNIDMMVDTLTASRSSFKSLSHKLDHRSKQYGLGGKIRMQMQDWIDILEGRVNPQHKMVPYGLKDNDDTEVIFWRELPYYNLPQATINKILKLIGIQPVKKLCVPKPRLGCLPHNVGKPFCLKCKKAHQQKYNLRQIYSKLFQCRQCKGFISND